MSKKRPKKLLAEDDPRIEYMAVDRLPDAPRNPKEHDLESIKRSFRRFGYVQPATLDERTGKLVAGHGRKEALQEVLVAEAVGP